MASLAPLGPVYQAGTLSGNPLATAAGTTVLELVTPERLRRTDAHGSAPSRRDARSGVAARGLVAHAAPPQGRCMGLFLTRDLRRAGRLHRGAGALRERTLRPFFHAMLERGVALAPGAYEILFVSMAHSDADLAARCTRRPSRESRRGHERTLRSVGWSVRPSFVPERCDDAGHPLADDHALTQLAGDPAVAWQTPWSELCERPTRALRARHGALRDRRRRALLLAQPGLADFEAWRRSSSPTAAPSRAPRAAPGVVAVVASCWRRARRRHRRVLLATPARTPEVAAASAVNLRLDDLPAGWYDARPARTCCPSSPAGQGRHHVDHADHPAADEVEVGRDQRALPRVPGRVQPTRPGLRRGGPAAGVPGLVADIRVAVLRRHRGRLDDAVLPTTTMVRRDIAEMSEPRFGSCFVTLNVAMIARLRLRRRCPTSRRARPGPGHVRARAGRAAARPLVHVQG